MGAAFSTLFHRSKMTIQSVTSAEVMNMFNPHSLQNEILKDILKRRKFIDKKKHIDAYIIKMTKSQCRDYFADVAAMERFFSSEEKRIGLEQMPVKEAMKQWRKERDEFLNGIPAQVWNNFEDYGYCDFCNKEMKNEIFRYAYEDLAGYIFCQEHAQF
jgi:hypothetical protein